jgi:hypothetical protein
MSSRTSFATIAVVASLLCAGRAHAFKEPGHRAIEAAAYRELLGDEAGRRRLAALIDHGILKPPVSPRPEPSDVLDGGYEHLLVESMVVHSHLPDHLMDRQLQADRQCFHFNARGGHFTLTDEPMYGMPRGLVVDAYVECIGVADALLRGILYDPAAARAESTDLYSLVHMIEDSYSDAHVARSGDVGRASDGERQHGDILFIKPWNLRTWLRYFTSSLAAEPVYQHFGSSHHMGSDTRDLGYLVGPTDEDYESKRFRTGYQERVRACLEDARPLVRPKSHVDAQEELTLEALYGELPPPVSCLSDRALAAKDAVVAMLELVADYAPVVARRTEGDAPDSGVRHIGSVDGVPFEEAWRIYREVYLKHRDATLTRTMTTAGPSPARIATAAPTAGTAALPRELRRDRAYSAKALAPREFKEAGFGLSVEVRGSTPLWLGLDTFVSRKTSSHNRTVVLLDTLGWGFQARLPLENEIGERPVGAAFDIGPGLPLPLSELIGLDELQLYVGARARVAYTAQAIFESETRHALELGFGGISVDAVVGGQAWLGLDLFRKTYNLDFWDSDKDVWSPLTFGLGGGLAIDAL